MKRLQVWKMTTLLLTGCVMIFGGLLLLADSHSVYAQKSDDEKEYIGSKECASCHRDLARTHEDTAHGLALQDVSKKKDPILADFSKGESLRTVQFPDSDTPRAFTDDDIQYAIGIGRYTQAYVYEVERNVYRVFPAIWDVNAGEWKAYPLADSWDDPAYNFVTQCAGCHTTALNVERGRWDDEGVQCEACHGPGSAHEELASDAGRNPDAEELVEVRGAINNGTDPQICGQCHSRGVSPDGSTAFPAGYQPGDTLADSFTLFTPDDTAHWYATGHASQPNMQYNEWLNSTHPNALSDMQQADNKDDQCLTCHSQDARFTNALIAQVAAGDREGDPLTPLTVDTAQFGVTCTTCHNPHSESKLPFNLVDEPYTLCVSCHSNTNVQAGTVHHPSQEMYEGRSLIETIPGIPGSHFTTENGPTCTTCHMGDVPVPDGTRISHALTPILPGPALNIPGMIDSCSSCHTDQASPAQMQKLIDDIQTDTRARIEAARAVLTDATPAWVKQTLDFVEGDGSYGVHNYAYTDELLDAVDRELGIIPATAALGQ